GEFYQAAGRFADRIVRLQTNGSVDPTFYLASASAQTNDGAVVLALALQTDGKLLAGGNFTALQGVPRNALTRLNPDGTVDTSFQPPFDAAVWVNAIRIQPDGKILVGGSLAAGDGEGFVARLNPDGTRDETFDPGLPPNGPVTDLLLLPDGNVVVAGLFTTFNGAERVLVARLKGGSGSYSRLAREPTVVTLVERDATLGFVVRRTGETNRVTTVDFATEPGTATAAQDFVSQSGTLTFLPGENAKTVSVAVQDDWLFEGEETFRVVLSNPGGGVVVLLEPAAEITILDDDRPGSVDPGFAAGTDVNGEVEALAVQPDGKILLAGDFGLVNGVPGSRYARLNPDGSLDTNF